MHSTVTANFEHPSAAEDAAAALVEAGFGQDQVLLFPGESDDVLRAQRLASPNHSERSIVAPDVGAAMGFTAGFLGGGFLGLLLGSGVLNIMGREPAMAAGPFLSALIGAVVLGLAGALCGFLFNAPLPALDPAPHGAPRTRLTVVSVRVAEDRVGEAVEMLGSKRPRDVNVWRSSNGSWFPV